MAADRSYEALRELLKPHIESLDYFIEEGLEKAIMGIQPSKLCHLRNADPQELVRHKEEMTEMGGDQEMGKSANMDALLGSHNVRELYAQILYLWWYGKTFSNINHTEA
ncbi:DNA-directed RNA polymerase I subunit RPA2 [Asimina triloba]